MKKLFIIVRLNNFWKFTINYKFVDMKKNLLLILVLFMTGILGLNAQASLEGTVKDKDGGAPLDFAYVKLYKGGSLITGTQTDIDGNYLMSNLDPGTYDVEASYIGYQASRTTSVVVKAGNIMRLDFELGAAGVKLDDVVIKAYKAPLIDIDNTTTGGTVTSDQIANLPTKSVNAIAATTAGVSSQDGGDMSFRGGRTNSNAILVDGIRVSANSVPQSEIEQMQVITGGLAAKYGDATGGLISITTKGPSRKFSGGIELETSQYLDPYGYNLASGYLSGPIIKKDDRTVLGFRLSGQYKYVVDNDPSAIGYYAAPESIIKKIEENPVTKFKTTQITTASYLRESDMGGPMKISPNDDNTDLNLSAKLDARISDNMDISLSGGYVDNANRFTPTRSGNEGFSSSKWRMLNWTNNPIYNTQRMRGNFRLRHKIGKQGVEVNKDEKKSGFMIRNANYTIRLGYERTTNGTQDYTHGDKLSRYGYYGSQDVRQVEAISIVDPETWHGKGTTYIGGRPYDFVGYFNVLSPFEASTDINPTLAKFNTINGHLDDNYSQVWDDLYFNTGKVYDNFSKSDNERYNFNVSAGFDIFPSGSTKGRHSIEIGVAGEMRINRYWSVNPIKMWELAKELQNSWIVGLDTNDIVGEFDAPVRGEDYTWLRYNTKLNKNEDSKFYKSVRDLLGRDEHAYVFVDRDLNPDQMSLDMFSAKELNGKNIMYYYGYDYLGNKLSNNVKFNDFFSEDGRKDFWSPAANPLYGGIYLQDKFSFKDIIMRIGMRVDYYDANTKVLKDPYSLYEIETAQEFYSSQEGLDKPESVGDDYKVYVSEPGSNNVIGFRKGDQWYSDSGIATDGSNIFKGGIVTPYYKERVDSLRNIQAKFYNPDISFEDYTPQVNFMPRIAFSFPISEDAGFFAHYDVLVQRPADRTTMTPMQYYYFEQKNNQTYNNPNLKPSKTIDYEVGFQQKLSGNSALKIQAFYREMRDMIRVRPYIFVPAISKYKSYGNLDYGTVKGFSFTYDFRRKGNIEFQVNYTLQFAFGTGSSSNAASGTSNRGIIRNLYPASFDERHNISAIIDYRYFHGKKYNGPELFGFKIFEDAGINLQTQASSGRPYTVRNQPTQFDATGYKGEINGARKPWYLEMNLKADKNFKITNKLSANIYIRVENLLNTKNVLGVYGYTGDPDDDGFLVSRYGESKINNIEAQGKPIDAFYDQYNWRLAAPGHYSRPRRIYMGVMFNL